MGELIAVLSGKGGTGKTSVCAALATALASADQKVLCIDCDVGLRNLDISLGLSDSGALSFLDVCQGDYGLEQAAVHPVYPSLSFLTAPMNCPADSIDQAAFGEFVRQAKGTFDYVFLDAPAGVDAGFRFTAAFADRCILVTGPGPAAIRDAARVGDLLELMGKTNVRLIVNRVSPKMVTAMATTVDDVMDAAGLPLLGVVPEDPNVTLAAVFGQPLLKYCRRSAAALACKRISKRLQGLPEPISLR
ncbi:MAG: P-loop NTPase [Oscillospiraceae bacterium]|nr:P-loop NTPase [Oscillospiraceae bacterium]